MSKYYVFTLNNWTEAERTSINDACERHDIITYLVYGRENGASGTPHLQGYLELSSRKRLNPVKRLLGVQRVHLEKRRGTGRQASDYCKKEDADPFVYGELVADESGRRTDLESAIDDLRGGASLRDLWNNHTSVMVRHSRGMALALENLRPPVEHTTFELESFSYHPLEMDLSKSQIIWGPSGTGKTSYALSLYPSALMVSHMDDLVRFNPDLHGAIVFDDMSFSHMPRQAQIHLVDQDHARSIHVRYQVATIPAHTIKIFTCNDEDGAIFLDDAAINRRIQKHRVLQL